MDLTVTCFLARTRPWRLRVFTDGQIVGEPCDRQHVRIRVVGWTRCSLLTWCAVPERSRRSGPCYARLAPSPDGRTGLNLGDLGVRGRFDVLEERIGVRAPGLYSRDLARR